MTLKEYYDTCALLVSSHLPAISSSAIFSAVFEDGTIIEWLSPQSWHHVFSDFKYQAQYSDCCGVLFCGTTPIRYTGPYLKPFLNLL